MSGYAIQRLTFGGMLDQSFRLLRDHFVVITVPMMALHVPYNIALDLLGISELGATVGANPAALLPLLWKILVVLLVFVVAAAFAQLVITHVIADCYLGREVGLGSAARRSLGTFLPYVGTSFLVTLAMLPLILLVLTIPLAVYFGVSWMLVGPVIVVEQLFGPKALERSKALIKGHFWESLALMLVASIMVSMISGVLGILFNFIPIVGPVLNGVVQGVTSSYPAVALVVLYIDLRCQHEDFDLQLLAQHVAAPAAPTPGG